MRFEKYLVHRASCRRLYHAGFGLGCAPEGGAVRHALNMCRSASKSVEVELHSLPPAFDGLRMLFISDIHAGPFVSTKALAHSFRRLLETEPDVILVGGATPLAHLLGGLVGSALMKDHPVTAPESSLVNEICASTTRRKNLVSDSANMASLPWSVACP